MSQTAHNLVQVQKASKFFGSRRLFDRITFSINEFEHVGVIGPNGAGKTTLFKTLLGLESFDEGEIIKSRQLRLGYLSQHDLWQPGETGNQYLARVSHLPLWEVKSQGRNLKLTEDLLDRDILTLSGGYRMRIKLLGLLGEDPNLMLLDEPTNYLDLETTILLEQFLQNFSGAFLLISHDREFLKRTTDHILEIESGEVTKFNGHIDDYFEQKTLLKEQLAAKISSQAEKRQSILDFVARFGAKATKAKQAQSRLRQLDKMQAIESKPLPVRAAILLPEPSPTGRRVVTLTDVDLGYGGEPVLKKVNLEILRGEHVAVVGLNGAGKSTLLKALSGQLHPLEGAVSYGHQVELGIFNQHVVEVLQTDATVLESLQNSAHPSVSLQEIKNLAGSLLFSGEDVQKKIQVLSGGEKSRVALGQILLKKVPFLLFDEPTNHLDFETVEALTQALQNFKGSLVIVSHDRGFVRRIGTKILEVGNGRVEQYPGTYDEYVWSLQHRTLHQEEDQVDPASPKKAEQGAASDHSPTKKISNNQLKTRRKRLLQVEKRIEQIQSRINELNLSVVSGESSSSQSIQAQTEEMSHLLEELNGLEQEWLELCEVEL